MLLIIDSFNRQVPKQSKKMKIFALLCLHFIALSQSQLTYRAGGNALSTKWLSPDLLGKFGINFLNPFTAQDTNMEMDKSFRKNYGAPQFYAAHYPTEGDSESTKWLSPDLTGKFGFNFLNPFSAQDTNVAMDKNYRRGYGSPLYYPRHNSIPAQQYGGDSESTKWLSPDLTGKYEVNFLNPFTSQNTDIAMEKSHRRGHATPLYYPRYNSISAQQYGGDSESTKWLSPDLTGKYELNFLNPFTSQNTDIAMDKGYRRGYGSPLYNPRYNSIGEYPFGGDTDSTKWLSPDLTGNYGVNLLNPFSSQNTDIAMHKDYRRSLGLNSGLPSYSYSRRSYSSNPYSMPQYEM